MEEDLDVMKRRVFADLEEALSPLMGSFEWKIKFTSFLTNYVINVLEVDRLQRDIPKPEPVDDMADF